MILVGCAQGAKPKSFWLKTFSRARYAGWARVHTGEIIKFRDSMMATGRGEARVVVWLTTEPCRLDRRRHAREAELSVGSVHMQRHQQRWRLRP